MLVSVSYRQHEDEAVKVDDALLDGDQAKIKTIAHQYIEKCNKDHSNNKPRNTTPDPFVNIIDE